MAFHSPVEWTGIGILSIDKTAPGQALDPSSANRPMSSKVYPERNRDLLHKLAPDAEPAVKAKWAALLDGWTPPV